MKKTILGILVLTIALTSFAQKPKKTYDETKFMKKVQFSFTPELISKNMPDDEALQYISEKTGKSLDELKAANETNLETIKKAITEINALGLVYVWDNAEVKVKQEDPVKIADILVHCHAKDKKFVFNLSNCVQTNLSWYLGDNIIPEGEGFKATVTAKENKKPGKFMSALKEAGEKQEELKKMGKELRAHTDSVNASRPGYKAKLFSIKNGDEVTRYYNFDLTKSYVQSTLLKGHYVKNDGEVIHEVIGFGLPEFIVGDTSTNFQLLICKDIEGGAVSFVDSDKNPNYKSYIKKEGIKAIYVEGHLFKKLPGIGWRLIINEGAIHTFVNIVKTKNGYVATKHTQKLAEKIKEPSILSTATDIKLAMMADAPEIVQGYKEGLYNLNEAEVKYNIWYDKKYPGKVWYHQDANG